MQFAGAQSEIDRYDVKSIKILQALISLPVQRLIGELIV